MRVGIYFGRHSRFSDEAVTARGYAQAILRLLEEPAQRADEAVFYGDQETLDRSFLDALELSPVLSSVCGTGHRVFARLSRRRNIRILVRVLPRTAGRELGRLGDQLLLPWLCRLDAIDHLHLFSADGLVSCSRPLILSLSAIPRRVVWRNIFDRTLRRAAAVIAESNGLVAAAVHRAGTTVERIQIVPPGLDEEFLSPLTEHAEEEILRRLEEWARSLNFPKNAIMIHAPSEDLPLLGRVLQGIEALSEAQRKLPLVVRNTDRKTLRFIRSFRAGREVVSLGPTSRSGAAAAMLLARLSIVAAPEERLPLMALEALACRCPLVASAHLSPGSGSAFPFIGCAFRTVPEITKAVSAGLDIAPEGSKQRVSLAREGLRRKQTVSKLEQTARATYRIYREVQLRRVLR